MGELPVVGVELDWVNSLLAESQYAKAAMQPPEPPVKPAEFPTMAGVSRRNKRVLEEDPANQGLPNMGDIARRAKRLKTGSVGKSNDENQPSEVPTVSPGELHRIERAKARSMTVNPAELQSAVNMTRGSEQLESESIDESYKENICSTLGDIPTMEDASEQSKWILEKSGNKSNAGGTQSTSGNVPTMEEVKRRGEWFEENSMNKAKARKLQPKAVPVIPWRLQTIDRHQQKTPEASSVLQKNAQSQGMRYELRRALPHGLYCLMLPANVKPGNSWYYVEENTTAFDCVLSLLKLLNFGCTGSHSITDDWDQHDWRCRRDAGGSHTLHVMMTRDWDHMCPVQLLEFKYNVARLLLTDDYNQPRIQPDTDIDHVLDRILPRGFPTQGAVGFRAYCSCCKKKFDVSNKKRTGTFMLYKSTTIQGALGNALYDAGNIESITCPHCHNSDRRRMRIWPSARSSVGLHQPSMQCFFRLGEIYTIFGSMLPAEFAMNYYSLGLELERWTWQWIATIAEHRIEKHRYALFWIKNDSPNEVYFYDPGGQKPGLHSYFGGSLMIQSIPKGCIDSIGWRSCVVCLELKSVVKEER